MAAAAERTSHPRSRGLLSVRAWLTLGNVCIFGLILGLLAILIRYGAQVWLSADMDHDLAVRAHRFASRRAVNPLPIPTPTPLPVRPVRPTTVPTMPSETSRLPSRALDLQRKRLIGSSPETPWDEETFALSAHGKSVYSTIDISDEEQARVYSIPLKRQGKIEGVLQVASRMGEVNQELGRLTRILLTLIPVAVLAAGAGGLSLTARALRPVRDMTHAAARIEAHNLSGRLPVTPGEDELSELAATFNGMLERLESAFEQQRRFTADASHELRTPLAAITGEASLALSEDRPAEEYRESLVAVAAAAQRMNRIVQDLLLLARSDGRQLPMDLQLLTIGDVLQNAVPDVDRASLPASTTTGAPILVPVPSGSDLLVVGDGHYLERLFLNLLVNARRHTPPEGTITISAKSQGGNVVVTVTDTGEGIAPEHLPHVFERFYRQDSARSEGSGGTGLGLAIAQSIVAAHNGTIGIESALGQGTTVRVTLPKARLTP